MFLLPRTDIEKERNFHFFLLLWKISHVCGSTRPPAPHSSRFQRSTEGSRPTAGPWTHLSPKSVQTPRARAAARPRPPGGAALPREVLQHPQNLAPPTAPPGPAATPPARSDGPRPLLVPRPSPAGASFLLASAAGGRDVRVPAAAPRGRGGAGGGGGRGG